MSQDTHVVSVEILGLRYPIRSTLDAGYVSELAAYVDAKMHAAAEDTEAADSVKIAVVAALNIADERFRAREGEVPSASPEPDALRDRPWRKGWSVLPRVSSLRWPSILHGADYGGVTAPGPLQSRHGPGDSFLRTWLAMVAEFRRPVRPHAFEGRPA